MSCWREREQLFRNWLVCKKRDESLRYYHRHLELWWCCFIFKLAWLHHGLRRLNLGAPRGLGFKPSLSDTYMSNEKHVHHQSGISGSQWFSWARLRSIGGSSVATNIYISRCNENLSGFKKSKAKQNKTKNKTKTKTKNKKSTPKIIKM